MHPAPPQTFGRSPGKAAPQDMPWPEHSRTSCGRRGHRGAVWNKCLLLSKISVVCSLRQLFALLSSHSPLPTPPARQGWSPLLGQVQVLVPRAWGEVQMEHGRFLWALQAEAASGEGAIPALAGYWASALGRAFPLPVHRGGMDAHSLRGGSGGSVKAKIILPCVYWWCCCLGMGLEDHCTCRICGCPQGHAWSPGAVEMCAVHLPACPELGRTWAARAAGCWGPGRSHTHTQNKSQQQALRAEITIWKAVLEKTKSLCGAGIAKRGEAVAGGVGTAAPHKPLKQWDLPNHHM